MLLPVVTSLFQSFLHPPMVIRVSIDFIVHTRGMYGRHGALDRRSYNKTFSPFSNDSLTYSGLQYKAGAMGNSRLASLKYASSSSTRKPVCASAFVMIIVALCASTVFAEAVKPTQYVCQRYNSQTKQKKDGRTRCVVPPVRFGGDSYPTGGAVSDFDQQ